MTRAFGLGIVHAAGTAMAMRDGPLRVLAVEDDDDLRSLYRVILESEGYEVAFARNGIEALSMLGWAPNVVILDLMLPGMDGYQFLRRLRAIPTGQRLPVLVVSAAVPPGRGTLDGAQAVLRKPFDFDHLLRTITRYAGRTN